MNTQDVTEGRPLTGGGGHRRVDATGTPGGAGSEAPTGGRTHLPRGPGVAAAPGRPGWRPGRWQRRSPGGLLRTERTWARPGAAPADTAPTDSARAGRRLGTGSGRGRRSGRSKMAAAAGGRAHAGAGPPPAARARRGRGRAGGRGYALTWARRRRGRGAGCCARRELPAGGGGSLPFLSFPSEVLLTFSTSIINFLWNNAFAVVSFLLQRQLQNFSSSVLKGLGRVTHLGQGSPRFPRAFRSG